MQEKYQIKPSGRRRKQRYLLTGSSARKLRRGGANLTAGRAFHAKAFPLSRREIFRFEVDFILSDWLAVEVIGTDLVRDRHLND